MLSSVSRALHIHHGSGSGSPVGPFWTPGSARCDASFRKSRRESESCFDPRPSGMKDSGHCYGRKPLLPFDSDFACFSYELAMNAFLY